MTRYMIVLRHDDEHDACVRALEAVRVHGSHLVTHVEWGCPVDVHRGWMIVECESDDEALRMVPPELRHDAQIVALRRFTPEEIEKLVAQLES